jgi:Predicted permeases
MGGGNIIGPLLLGLGIRPEIATISSSFSIFLSSGTAAAQFFIKGQIQIDYAGWFLGVSILGSLGGILVLRRYAIKNIKFLAGLLLSCNTLLLLNHNPYSRYYERFKTIQSRNTRTWILIIVLKTTQININNNH